MTLQEIEHSFKIHEQRFNRIEDNLAVQGEILNRIDQRLDRVTERMEGLTEIAKLHTNQMAVMQSAMTALFQRMDAFIRGLERGNGDTPAGAPR